MEKEPPKPQVLDYRRELPGSEKPNRWPLTLAVVLVLVSLGGWLIVSGMMYSSRSDVALGGLALLSAVVIWDVERNW